MIVKGSAAKRHRQSEKRRIHNKMIRSRVRSASRKVLEAVAAQDAAAAQREFHEFTRLIDSAARKGVFHSNTAARKKSRVARRVNAIQS